MSYISNIGLLDELSTFSDIKKHRMNKINHDVEFYERLL